MGIDEETLQYPAKIAERIGLASNEINAMKRKGCPFYGRKTSVKLVREFIYRTMGAGSSTVQSEHLQHSAVSKSDEREN